MNRQKLFLERLEKVIPGGAHTYSRGSEIYPLNAPKIFSYAKGAYSFTNNNDKFLDYNMALRSVILGFANDEVNKAAISAIKSGNTMSKPSFVELEAAELFVDTVDSVDMVKFAKNGSNVTTAAIKLARAYTEKKYVCFPKEQPFFSFDDWFISSTEMNHGTINDGFNLSFKFGDIDSLKKIFDEKGNEIACVILEPSTHINPCVCKKSICLPKEKCCGENENFLSQVRKICDKYNSVLILDEMITGYRWHLKGAQKYFDIKPDLTTFGKAIANGFSIAALGGKKEIMEYGSTNIPNKERVFLLSSTHGAEMSSLAAYIKTTELIKKYNVPHHIWQYNNRLMLGMQDIISSNGLNDSISVEGNPYAPIVNYHNFKQFNSMELKYFCIQELINENILMPWIATSYSHNEKDLISTLNAFDVVLKRLKCLENFKLDGGLKTIFRYKN